MAQVTLLLQSTESKSLLEKEVEMDFLPRVGDSINAYDLIKDLKNDNDDITQFFIIYTVEWSIEGSSSKVKVKATPHNYSDRDSILSRYGWLGPKLKEESQQNG